MGSGTKIFRQIAMASYTDLRPDIGTLLLRREDLLLRGGRTTAADS